MTSALIVKHLTGVIKQDWCLHKAVTKSTPWIDFSMSVRNWGANELLVPEPARISIFLASGKDNKESKKKLCSRSYCNMCLWVHWMVIYFAQVIQNTRAVSQLLMECVRLAM